MMKEDGQMQTRNAGCRLALGVAVLTMLTGACTQDYVVDRESAVVSALQPSHRVVTGPLGPSLLPQACLDQPSPASAGRTPPAPGGCAVALAFDETVTAPADLLRPRRAGPPLARSVAGPAERYYQSFGPGLAGGGGTVQGGPEEQAGVSLSGSVLGNATGN